MYLEVYLRPYQTSHGVKSVRIWSFSRPYFSAFTPEKLQTYGHISRSVYDGTFYQK